MILTTGTPLEGVAVNISVHSNLFNVVEVSETNGITFMHDNKHGDSVEFNGQRLSIVPPFLVESYFRLLRSVAPLFSPKHEISQIGFG